MLVDTASSVRDDVKELTARAIAFERHLPPLVGVARGAATTIRRRIVKAMESCGVPRATIELVNVRVGQINGCSVCVDMHCRALQKLDESDTRIFALAAWRETPYYTEAERAALALAEVETRLGDRSDAVSDDVWNEASRHFSEAALAALVMTIAIANLWNRLNVTTRQVTGDWIAQYV